MFMNRKQHSSGTRTKQASNENYSHPNTAPFDFCAKNLTPHGGLLLVATMCEKIRIEKMVAETITVDRTTRVMTEYQFLLTIILGLYVGFARLNQMCYIARDSLLARILKVAQLPPQRTPWRILNSLRTGVSRQIQSIQRRIRKAVWAAGNICGHSGRTGVNLSEHYEERGLFQRLMERLRAIKPFAGSFVPVVDGAFI